MAEPWESAPIVDDEPWAQAPAVGPAAPTRGAAAIPGNASGVAPPPAASPPPRQKDTLDFLLGAPRAGQQENGVSAAVRKWTGMGLDEILRHAVGTAEAALNTVTGMTTGFAGGMLGGANAVGAQTARLLTGQDPSQVPGPQEGFDAGAQAGTYQPRTETGQNQAEAVGKAINDAVVPLGPNPGALAAGIGGLRARAMAQEAAERPAGQAPLQTRIADAVTPSIAPEKAALAIKADDAGIPLRPDMLGDSKIAKLAGETAEQVPLSGSSKKARQAAFNTNVIEALDPEAKTDRLTPDVFAQAMDKAGGEIEAIAERTPVPATALDDLANVGKHDTPDVQQVLESYRDDLAQAAAGNDGVVPGETLRKIRSEVGRQSRASSNGDLRYALGDFAKKMDDALSEHATEGDMDALMDARRRYAIGKTLEPLVAKSPDGSISPAALMARVTADRAGKARMARGRGGDLGDYARIGQAFLKEQASSGTAERSLVYGAVTDTAKAAKMAALYPVAAAYNLLGPRIARRMVDKARRVQEAEKQTAAAPPPEPTLAQGFDPAAQGRPSANPLGDLTPDWETAPGAAPAGAPHEVVPTEGLVPAVGEAQPLRVGADTTPAKRAGQDIPAVPGRPDLPDTMVAGAPAELAPDAATGAAMQTPEAQLAMRGQQTDRNVAAAATETPHSIPAGEATEIKPQQVEPASAPKDVDPRLAEIEQLKASTTSDVVHKALDERAGAVKKELKAKADAEKRVADAAELRRTAEQSTDPEIKSALITKADALDKTSPKSEPKAPEKIPTGEAKEVTRSGVEVAPEKVPAAEAKELYVDPNRETLADLDFPKLDEAFMHEQQRAQQAREPEPSPKVLERGRRQTRDALEKGMSDGSLGKDEAGLALWALDKNPNLGRGLRVELAKNAKEDIARGLYVTAERVVKLFQDKGDPERAAHEILHHSERMMPPEVQRGIRREWRAALDAEIKKSDPKTATALRTIADGITGGKEAFDAMKAAFADGTLSRTKHYHLTNPSEFWAVNATRLLSERYAGRNSWRLAAVRWLKDLIEHTKGSVGLRSDSPIIKALNEVLDAKSNGGADRSPSTLKTAEAKAMIASETDKPAPITHVLVDSKTGKEVGEYETEKRAEERKAKLDRSYGAGRYELKQLDTAREKTTKRRQTP